jgi:hypothetical protein
MLHKTHIRLALLFLVFVSFPLSALSQDNPPTVKPSDWSDWRSAPNFPGIKIRVLCSTYLQSSGNAEWNFQFQNTYSKKIYLVYQEEASDSTGTPPKFGAPGGRNLGPGEKSDAYTDYLRGTCDSRKQIFIRIVSIDDAKGVPLRAQAGSSRSSGFGRTSHLGSNVGGHLDDSQTAVVTASTPSNDVRGNHSTATTGGTNALNSGTTTDANGIVGKWTCKEVNTPVGFGDGTPEAGPTLIYAFNNDGTYYRGSGGPYTWSLRGTAIIVEGGGTRFDRPGTGQRLDPTHMAWVQEYWISPDGMVKTVRSVSCER